MTTRRGWLSTFALGAMLLMGATGASSTSVWDGQFRTPSMTSMGEPGTWVFQLKCKASNECAVKAGYLENDKLVPFDDLPSTDIFKPSPQMTKSLRLAVEFADASDDTTPDPTAYYQAHIYPQIGSPYRVLECRSGSFFTICLLDRALVQGSGGIRSEWILLAPDFSSGTGCLYAPVCPAVLVKQ